jgi:hypothetical protein
VLPHNIFRFVDCAIERRIYRLRITFVGSAEEKYGDDDRGCDIRDNAVLDAICFVGGIFVVARTA